MNDDKIFSRSRALVALQNAKDAIDEALLRVRHEDEDYIGAREATLYAHHACAQLASEAHCIYNYEDSCE